MVGENGEIQGRCAIVENSDSLFGLQAGIVTVGGLYGGVISGMAGILVGRQSDLLNRSVAIPIVEQEALASWANNQAELLRFGKNLTWKKSSRLLALGAAFDELLVVAHGTEDWTANKVNDELSSRSELWLLEDLEFQYQSDIDEVMKSDFDRNLNLDPRVLISKIGVAANEFINASRWPSPMFKNTTTWPIRLFEKLVREKWPNSELVKSVDKTIGHVSGIPINRPVDIIYRIRRIDESDT
jgi:hypothetical protein